MWPMSDPKRVHTKLEQSSLRLALSDFSLRFRHPLPAVAIALTYSTSTNSRTITLVIAVVPHFAQLLRPSPEAERLSPLATYTKPSSSSPGVISSPLTITLHEWLLRSQRAHYQDRSLAVWSIYHTSHHLYVSIPAYTPAAPSCRPTARKTANQRNARCPHCSASCSSSNTLMQNARQENSEPHQLRTSPSRDDHVEEHIKTGGLHG
ncbi:hypothetical protein DSO57_1010472 [Entomophthora muscae]|uniref:Uncharacterized protein n=1 Tax=Entomophthora muscae TaxID=34485 RepID=A0ACC2SJ90_9FUNG|nr:hypothetical protein DSO57_1010472 [Entomophthora muscae]